MFRVVDTVVSPVYLKMSVGNEILAQKLKHEERRHFTARTMISRDHLIATVRMYALLVSSQSNITVKFI